MCGIAGLVAANSDPENVSLVLRMLERIGHRGPDGCGLFTPDGVWRASSPAEIARVAGNIPPAAVLLGQTRLAITGNMEARQPFVSLDGGLALAHNGEVYNHNELATILRPTRRPETGSDSEVVLRVLEEHYASTGDLAGAMRRTVGAASGMYALAATDGRETVLARDAIGKKPLYYVDGPDLFAYASERKALAEAARLEARGIERVLPGEIVVRKPGGRTVRKTVERLALPAIDVTDREDGLRRYGDALERSVARRTQGVFRAAVLFSGGVDSVLVGRMLQRAGVEVTGYVAGAEKSSDLLYAPAAARALSIPLRSTVIDEATLEKDLPSILEATELHGPLMTETSLPMWYSAKLAREDGHRVIFTGQAADELFAGYPWYPWVLRGFGAATLHARLWEDLLALPLDTLEREDRISMHWSLEMRAPFLDADVIRAAMRMSPLLKLDGPDDLLGKRIHRELAVRMGVPRAIALREKAPAQEGASVHDLLASIALRRYPNGAPPADVPDFGSNYRYRDEPGSYASPEVYALLDAIVREGGFVTSGEDGTARVVFEDAPQWPQTQSHELPAPGVDRQ